MKITIFTATYNRCELLKNLYDSLKIQSNKDFEWIIVDDDSTDSTESNVNSFIKNEKQFLIKYIKQEHGGKHRAINKGVQEANGEYFFIVDSDDYITENAVELIYKWIEIAEKSNKKLAGIAGLKSTEIGEISGGKPLVNNQGWIDADYFERDKYNLNGEKAEIFKTKLLKENPFPEFKDEYFVTEALIWNEIYSKGYKMRWFDEVIYKFEYLDDGLTKSGANELEGYFKNYYGFTEFVKQNMRLFGVINKPRIFKNYILTAKRKEKKITDMAKDLNITKSKLIVNIILLPIGFSKSLIKKILKKIKKH